MWRPTQYRNGRTTDSSLCHFTAHSTSLTETSLESCILLIPVCCQDSFLEASKEFNLQLCNTGAMPAAPGSYGSQGAAQLPHVCCTWKACGLARGSFLISAFNLLTGNEKLCFATYQHCKTYLSCNIHAGIFPSCMYCAAKILIYLTTKTQIILSPSISCKPTASYPLLILVAYWRRKKKMGQKVAFVCIHMHSSIQMWRPVFKSTLKVNPQWDLLLQLLSISTSFQQRNLPEKV